MDDYDYSWYDPGTDVSAGDQEFLDFMSGAAGDQEFQDFMSGAAGDQEFQDFMNAAAAEDAGSGFMDLIKSAASQLGSGATSFLKKHLYDPSTGKVNLAGLGTAAAALSMLRGSNKTITNGGYNKPIPKYDAVRQQIANIDPNRVPGSSGLQYFTDTKYATQGDAPALAAARAADTTQKQGILAARPAAPAPAANPYAGTIPTKALSSVATNPMVSAPPAVAEEPLPVPKAQLTGGLKMAQGGLASFAKGGNKYLRGSTDGMADKLDTTIDDTQAAKLSHGEFVIPADVVSHLGNGNSEAGARKLYAMMARIRKARTGNSKQGKRINPDKFLPKGSVDYAGGGIIAFSGEAGSSVPAANTNTSAVTTPASTSTSSNLSPYAGDYVTDYLGKGQALANAPYQAYQGPLTAGASNLQQQAFAGASDLAKTGYTPTQFTTGSFDTAAANKYMNPYLQASLDPQLKELQRQSQINNMADASKLTQAGAYGGSRQAILQGEENRNLLDKSQNLIGQGYNNAYNTAMNQFNVEQGRGMDAQKASEASRVYGADYGLKSVQNLADLGAVQRGITGEGIAADKAQFEEQRDDPYKKVQYQKDLLTGLPITTTTNATNTTDYANLIGGISDLKNLYSSLSGLGVTS
jgi:hypothetical protein